MNFKEAWSAEQKEKKAKEEAEAKKQKTKKGAQDKEIEEDGSHPANLQYQLNKKFMKIKDCLCISYAKSFYASELH